MVESAFYRRCGAHGMAVPQRIAVVRMMQPASRQHIAPIALAC